ncbi:RapZ family nucleotide-binding protein [Zoogloea sp.]|uniref:RNase adapter RapZ n=1 Tax=Zoogloea sp. TaxID=49181 RepID=UPI0014160998|nr:MAG: RNase adapter RapZ [Zoogloea sp.]
MQLVLISGLSGSGKSVALNVMEDSGHYVVDNLPAALLPQLVSHLRGTGYQRIAVAVDVRSGASIAALPRQVEALRAMVSDLRFLFLDARDDVLIARFSETRRRHPLGDECSTLGEAISREREALALIAELGQHIDTSDLSANTLRNWVKSFVGLEAGSQITVLFESFGFKHGLPLDADLVFDVRCLPNPHYDPMLRPLTGKDGPVIEFLCKLEEVGQMVDDIYRFVASWLPSYVNDNRSYLTIAIGCTGGQHRSVYIAEKLAEQFRETTRVQVRHRSLKA